MQHIRQIAGTHYSPRARNFERQFVTDQLLRLFGPTDNGFLFDNLAKQAYRDLNGDLVSADGQAVPLIMDRSKGMKLGPELVSGYDFSTWGAVSGTTALSAHAFKSTAVGGVYKSLLTAGKFYRASFDATSDVDSVLQVRSNAAGGSPNEIQVSLLAGVPQSVTVFFKAATDIFWLRSQITATTIFQIDNLTLKEVLGNHALQATAASQATYKVASPPYLSFDGGDSYALPGDAGVLDGDFAIYVAAEATWASGTAKALLTKSDTSYSAGQWPLFWCFDVLGNGSGRFVWNLTSGANGSASVTSASALTAGPHVLGVERSGSTIQYFVDGVASGASATSSVALGNFTANIEMGRFWFGSSGYVEYLSGKVYHPGIMIDRSFSADERTMVVSKLGTGLS